MPHYTDLAYKVFSPKVVMHSEVEMLCISDEVVCCMKLVGNVEQLSVFLTRPRHANNHIGFGKVLCNGKL